MSEYKGIRGWKVQTVSTDPASSGMASATWSSGGALNTGRHNSLGRAGTQTAALVAAGTEAPASATVNTELYDGSSWTEVNNVNQARQDGGGAGATNTAALIFGGYFPGPNTRYGNTETWNGTNWTEVNDLNSARNSVGGAGTQTSALYFGGFDPSVPGFTGKTESWNGTSWTEVSDLNTARSSFGTFGYSNTAVIAASGSPTPSAVESWNGSSWTEIAELNTSRTSAGGSGESTDGLIFGGYTTTEVGNTESWNGTAWTELNDLANVRRNGAGALGGTSSTALYAGGVTPATGYSTVTEEWTAPSVFQKENLGQVFYNSTSNAFKVTQQSVSAGTWASGGNLNTSRYQISGDGSTTAAIVAGGDVYPNISPRASAITEIYNGTSWTEVNDLNNAAQTSRNFGTVTASIAVNNYPTVNTEIWNGTSWTNSPTTLNTARFEGSGTGISTAGLYSGGNTPGGVVANNETWNGTSWTEVGDLNTGRKTEGSGSQTSAIVVGGQPTPSAITEIWDGTSWTEVADLNTARAENGVAAENNTSAITWCGDLPGGAGRVNNVESWNGTSWTEVADYPISNLRYTGNAGSSSAALGFGGINDAASPATTTSTNEWVVPIQNQTITVS